jgi:magnesium transporter
MHSAAMSTHHPGKPRPRRHLAKRPHRDPRPPGLPPGSLVFTGQQRVSSVTFRVIDYSPSGVREMQGESVPDCVAFEGKDSPTWIMVTGLHDVEKIGELLAAYDIHPLVQDDILNTRQQPKLEDFGSYLFVTAKQLTAAAATVPESFDLQQFSLILTGRVLITFHEGPTAIFDPILKRLHDGKGRLRNLGPDYLMWALLDTILDHHLACLADMEEKVSAADEQLTGPDNNVTLADIHTLRAGTQFLYRTVRPMREIVVALQHSESDLISRVLNPFLRDLYDHSWHAIETAEHLREAVIAMREYHQAILAQRMNEVMKILTALSIVFMPLTFIAGVYGMNFKYQPEYDWAWGYPFVWLIFVLTTLATIWYFRRKKWL